MTSNEDIRKNAETIDALFEAACGGPFPFMRDWSFNLSKAGGEFIRKRLRELKEQGVDIVPEKFKQKLNKDNADEVPGD